MVTKGGKGEGNKRKGLDQQIQITIYIRQINKTLLNSCTQCHVITYNGKISEKVYMCMLSHSIMSDSLQPHGLQPVRLLCPQDSSGKNTEDCCHLLLQYMCIDRQIHRYFFIFLFLFFYFYFIFLFVVDFVIH